MANHSSDTPLVFANKVIHKMLGNLFAAPPGITPGDYLQMRLVYRRMGGLWQPLWQGDPESLALLHEVVKAWGSVHPAQEEVV